ncbi:MAG: type II toxin-antitoxin system HipA family toxin YjjJ [Gammaproteobacteria bacterium]|nr:type II toxin-antitoxin system HipA family toxin YjjJ [Gammaproteobacteria bacterium]MBU1653902.1 type II toxin-antitoxin system HipA family toxin YjjJ [Gammaproteobacteria bacterium]MBU1962347.1 type II toxin-antitoxin system HipA family toxin YjjJ [Gammaproteobacteria bacterium]
MTHSIIDRLERGPATSRELQLATGLSQPAVSRQLRGLGRRVVRLPGGKTPRYAIARNAFGADDSLPLYSVDPFGNNLIVAHIRPLAHGGFFVEGCTGMPKVLLGDGGDGVYDDLPYFLDDLRPQGFLGRQIAEEMAGISPDFPTDPRRWNAEHIGRYLISNGDDLPGNFKFGPAAHLRIRQRPEVVSCEDYPALAERVLRGVIPGSSAGGERPKFTAYNGERGHVIVKFSPAETGPMADRWRDILITEFHASEAIHTQGFPAAETRLIERKGRLFLESQRFDRSGEFGRLPMLSLQAVDAEFTGLGSDWPRVVLALSQRGLLNPQHAYDAIFLWTFGRLINNTDMHLGNISFSIEGDVFRILPLYDMCCMGFAPKAAEVGPFNFVPPDLGREKTMLSDDGIIAVRKMAHDFWGSVAADERISKAFREFLGRGSPVVLR